MLVFQAIEKKPPMRERRGVPAEAPVRIAHVVSVSGSHAVAVLERSSEAVLRSKDPRIQIGSVVKILTPGASVIGLVSSVSSPMPDLDGKKEEMGLIEINLAGETRIDDTSRRLVFHRGVANLPSLGDPIYLADKHDLTRIYAPPGVASIKVGTLFQNSAVPARLMIDDLLSKHFIVVGSTGSGKSSALSIVLQRLLEDTAGAHVVILDIHNEYGAAFGDLVEHINLENFDLPLWMLNFQELVVALTSSEGTRDEEIEILSEGVLSAKKRYADAAAGRASVLTRRPGDVAVITVDTPAPFRLSDVIAYLDEQLGRLERTRATLPYRRLKARIEQLVADQRYNFMFGGLTVQDTMTSVLSRLFRIPNDGKPISVIDLSTVPHEILDVVISVISRLAFDLAVWSKGGLPMLLVCEEAHRYAPANDGKFVPTRQALGRIAKEGRKYGISLALVTQRPSELDSTILSQCSTAIALRLSSEKDQQVIRGSTYEGMLDLIDFLPLLGDREALILGQGVSMPMRIRFDELSAKRPRNMNIGFSKSWKSKNMDRDMLDTIVTRWRTTGRERHEDKF
jgi:DNA helicase HerA-like ATPase